MYLTGKESEDVAFIYGCSVRPSMTEGHIRILLSSGNYLDFTRDSNNRLIINELLYKGTEELDTLVFCKPLLEKVAK